MWGWIGPALELIKEGFVWGTSESGYAEFKKRREGKRLQAAADEAFATWIEASTEDNWKAYQDAKAALIRHSTTP